MCCPHYSSVEADTELCNLTEEKGLNNLANACVDEDTISARSGAVCSTFCRQVPKAVDAWHKSQVCTTSTTCTVTWLEIYPTHSAM
jgi:hypothetical protein